MFFLWRWSFKVVSIDIEFGRKSTFPQFLIGLLFHTANLASYLILKPYCVPVNEVILITEVALALSSENWFESTLLIKLCLLHLVFVLDVFALLHSFLVKELPDGFLLNISTFLSCCV